MNQKKGPEELDDDRRRIMEGLKEAEMESRKTGQVTRELRARLLQMQKNPTLSDADAVELGEQQELVLREMKRLELVTKRIQTLVGCDVSCEVVRQLYEEQMLIEMPPPLPDLNGYDKYTQTITSQDSLILCTEDTPGTMKSTNN